MRTYASLLAAAALVVGGCGDDQPQPRGPAPTPRIDRTYATEIKQVDDSLDAVMQALFADQQMTEREIAGARRALADASRELRQLQPPAEVREHHEAYRAGVDGFRPIIDRIAASRGDAARIRAHLTDPEYAAVIQQLDSAKQGLAGKGYEL